MLIALNAINKCIYFQYFISILIRLKRAHDICFPFTFHSWPTGGLTITAQVTAPIRYKYQMNVQTNKIHDFDKV